MRQFDHEKLKVYQEAIAFVAWSTDILETLPKSSSVHKQFDRASPSISLNIAEGNGNFTSVDRCKFFDIARGSALECAACLDVACARKLVGDKVLEGKEQLLQIVSMLVGLIKANSKERKF